MDSIFTYQDYKDFVADWIKTRPKGGHGQYQKISKTLGLNSSMISQIFKGDKHLSPEHGALLTDFLGLNEDEGDYFLLILNYGRAGSHRLQGILEKQIAKVQQEYKKVVKRVTRDVELSEEQKSRFYSSWLYSAVRLSVGDPSINNIEDICGRFEYHPSVINRVVQFLLDCQLIKLDDQGKLQMGPTSTHIPQESPWANVHATNWRKKAFERHEHLREEELIYNSPVSLNYKDAIIIKEMNIDHIQKVLKIVRETEPVDTLMCLGIDWFNFCPPKK